jgi:uncharacterized membrane-anchored protein
MELSKAVESVEKYVEKHVPSSDTWGETLRMVTDAARETLKQRNAVKEVLDDLTKRISQHKGLVSPGVNCDYVLGMIREIREQVPR